MHLPSFSNSTKHSLGSIQCRSTTRITPSSTTWATLSQSLYQVFVDFIFICEESYKYDDQELCVPEVLCYICFTKECNNLFQKSMLPKYTVNSQHLTLCISHICFRKQFFHLMIALLDGINFDPWLHFNNIITKLEICLRALQCII